MHDRKPRYLGLGSASSVSLATARSLAGDARRQLDLGQDPIEAKRLAEKEAAADKARSMTFKECAEAYMAAHEPSWKNAKHREQWHSTLRRLLYPKFGGVAVSSVTTEMVLCAVQPIWHSMPETASRVRGRIEVVIDWAKARGAFSGENPARWRGHLANLLRSGHSVLCGPYRSIVEDARPLFGGNQTWSVLPLRSKCGHHQSLLSMLPLPQKWTFTSTGTDSRI